MLITATEGGVDLCKTLLGAQLLDYPIPVLLAWNHEEENAQDGGWVMAGGSHMAKISATRDYLNSLSSKQDDELVMMTYGSSSQKACYWSDIA